MDSFRKTGAVELSIAGLGCNNFGMRIDEDATDKVVEAALDAGITNFDTADVYGDGKSEEFLGRALGDHRTEVVITTKFGSPTAVPEGFTGGQPEWIRRAIDNSLNRLQTDYIDLYLLHRPDPETPIGDTLSALGELLEEGKVLEIGCSDFTAEMLEEAAIVADDLGIHRFANVQNHLSVLERGAEEKVIPECDRLGITFTPYFPLESGLLTGKYTRGEPAPEGTRLAAWTHLAGTLNDARMDAVARLDDYAQDHGHSLLELALSWLASSVTVASVIAGATSPKQLRANVAATTAWSMTDQERADIRGLATIRS